MLIVGFGLWQGTTRKRQDLEKTSQSEKEIKMEKENARNLRHDNIEQNDCL